MEEDKEDKEETPEEFAKWVHDNLSEEGMERKAQERQERCNKIIKDLYYNYSEENSFSVYNIEMAVANLLEELDSAGIIKKLDDYRQCGPNQ